MKKLTKLLFAGFLALAIAPAAVLSLTSAKNLTQARADAVTTEEVSTWSQIKTHLESNYSVKILLTADIFESPTQYWSSIQTTGNKVLDLNGHQLSVSGSIGVQSPYVDLIEVRGGSLSIAGDGKITFGYSSQNDVGESSIIYANGGNVSVNRCELCSTNGPTIKIKSGNVSVGDHSVLKTFNTWLGS